MVLSTPRLTRGVFPREMSFVSLVVVSIHRLRRSDAIQEKLFLDNSNHYRVTRDVPIMEKPLRNLRNLRITIC